MEQATDVWATVRRRRQRSWRAFAWGPVVLVVAICTRHAPAVAIAVSLLWIGWLAVCAFQLESSLCPRCGRLLFRDGAYHNSLVSQCLHCRQAIGGPVSAPDAQS